MRSVRRAMCRPRRSDHTATRTATSSWRVVTPPVTSDGVNAPAQPTAPSPKVQVVSIQPELRVLRQASQAPVMIAARPALTVTTIARNMSAVMARQPARGSAISAHWR
jgi:hypothetical protein